MSAWKFTVRTPEELRQLTPFVKDGDVENTATVWSANRRRNIGACHWDGRIFVSFWTEDRKRIATVNRVASDGWITEIARLKYVPSLGWCSSNLPSFRA